MSRQPDPRNVADLYQAYQHGGNHGILGRMSELYREAGEDENVIYAEHAAYRLATGEAPCSYGSPDTCKQPDDYCPGCTMKLD